MDRAKPFIKWVGGKSQILDQISLNLPSNFKTYFEPFLGGGAVLFYILENYNIKKAIASDINSELINTYKVVKNNVDDLINLLDRYKNSHSERFYYKIRGVESRKTKNLGLVLNDNDFQNNNLEKAARFIYLNKTCFNGLYRVNKDNKFNVPMGRYKNPAIFNKNHLKYISNILQEVEFRVCSFEEILPLVKKEDFVYLDPPYDKLKDNSFTTYTKDNFSKIDQKKLKNFCDLLDKKKCNFLESNSSTKFIKDIYSQYNIKEINAKRMINSDSSKRGNIKEVLIRNYKVEE